MYCLIFILFLCLITPLPAEEIPFASKPVSLSILLAGKSLTQGEQEIFNRTINGRVQSLAGRYWDFRIENSQEDFSVLESRFVKSTENDLSEIKSSVCLLSYEQLSGTVTARYFDQVTGYLGPRTQAHAEHTAQAANLAVDLIFESYAPLARVENSSSDTAVLRLQGDELIPDHAPIKQWNETVFIPFVRMLDREGKLIRVDPVPATALIVQETDPRTGRIRCRIESSRRDPLGIRRRGRVELLALAVQTPMQPTMIQLQPRSESAEQAESIMPPYEIREILSEKGQSEIIGYTDHFGRFSLEPLPTQKLRILTIKSGQTTMARIPVIRGYQDYCKILVPDDSVRLDAEAYIRALQEELLDTIARREILKLRLNRLQQMKDRRLEMSTRNELNTLKDIEKFIIDLHVSRKRFETNDPLVKKRIDKMFRDTEKMLLLQQKSDKK